MGRPRVLSSYEELKLLRLLALRKKLTSRALAKRFGCSEGTINNLATGKNYQLRVTAHMAGLSRFLSTRCRADQPDRLSITSSGSTFDR